MSAFRNLPVARKFAFAFGLVCSLCLILGAYTFITFRDMAVKSVKVSEDSFPSVVHLAAIRGAVNVARREDLDLLLCQAPACTSDHTAKRQLALSEYQTAVKLYEPFISSSGERELYQKFTATFDQYHNDSDRAIALLAEGKIDGALGILMSDSAMSSVNITLSGVNDSLNLKANTGMKSAHDVTQESQRAMWINVGVILSLVLICALIGVTLTRLIAPPLQAATAALEQVAAKDLTVTVESHGTDEIGRMCSALNTSVPPCVLCSEP